MTDTTTLPTTHPAQAAPFRWRLANRPDVRFGHAAGGVAGILAAAAVVAFVVEVTDDDATLPGVGFNLVLIAVALAAGFFLRGPVRSAGVAAIAIAIPQVWFFAIAGDGDAIDRGDYRVVLLLSLAAYLLFYLLTWTRGRALLLGLALLFGTSWIVFEVTSQNTPFAVEVVGEAQSGRINDPSSVLGGQDNKITETAIVDLVIAVGLLGAGVVLDRRRRAGAATPVLLVGGIYAVSAALTFGVDAKNVYATGAFVAVAGLVIGLAGSLGRRRGTSWIGSIVLLAGVVTVVAKGTGDTASGSNNAAVFGGFALAGAAVLLLAGIVVARALDEPVDGGEPFTPKPPVPVPEPEPEPVAVGAPAVGAADTTAVEPTAPIAWVPPSAAAAPEPAAEPDGPAAPAVAAPPEPVDAAPVVEQPAPADDSTPATPDGAAEPESDAAAEPESDRAPGDDAPPAPAE